MNLELEERIAALIDPDLAALFTECEFADLTDTCADNLTRWFAEATR